MWLEQWQQKGDGGQRGSQGDVMPVQVCLSPEPRTGEERDLPTVPCNADHKGCTIVKNGKQYIAAPPHRRTWDMAPGTRVFCLCLLNERHRLETGSSPSTLGSHGYSLPACHPCCSHQRLLDPPEDLGQQVHVFPAGHVCNRGAGCTSCAIGCRGHKYGPALSGMGWTHGWSPR